MRYRALIGTGGIGTGSFFALDGNHTLGREESRTGRFLECRDYAKLHIIAHYMQTLMGSGFSTFPVGTVGEDEPGNRLCDEMRRAGLDIRHVRKLAGTQTMNCVCLLYPDGSGGNLTVADSACSRVDPSAVRVAEPEFIKYKGHGIALVVPEVPLQARNELLELGTCYGFLRAASFTSAELRESMALSMLAKTDLITINRDEAEALTDSGEEMPLPDVIASAVRRLRSIQPAIRAIITSGRDGSWLWDGEQITHLDVHDVEVRSAAGAGDAFFAGVLAGVASGLTLAEAHQLGNLCGALSVSSPHTINHALDRASLAALAAQATAPPAARVSELLGIPVNGYDIIAGESGGASLKRRDGQ